MMKSLMAAVATLALLPAGAQAAVSVTAQAYGYAAPSGDVLIDFDSALPTGYTLTGGAINSGTNVGGSAPWVSPGVATTSNYLSVTSGSATLQGSTGYSTLSLYAGSLDPYNTLTLLDSSGASIASFTGSQLAALPNFVHNQDRFTFTVGAGDPLIAGFTATTTRPHFEIDNVVFSSAVPEPASWAMMIGGIGIAGGSLRARRRTALAA